MIERQQLLHFPKCVFVTSEKTACAMLSHVASPALILSPTLTDKGHNFQKKKKKEVTAHKTCFSNLSINLSKTFLIPRRTGPRYDQIYILFSCKVHVILMQF